MSSFGFICVVKGGGEVGGGGGVLNELIRSLARRHRVLVVSVHLIQHEWRGGGRGRWEDVCLCGID